MKLSDVVSSMHITIYAEVPLLIFMGIFIGVCVSMLRQGAKLDEVAQLPLRNERAPRRRP
jgi:cbb3-type cytochrome oxidase subunit 3